MKRLLLLSQAVVLVAAVACGDDGGGSGGSSTSSIGQGGAAQSTGADATGTGGEEVDPCDRIPEACFDAASCYADPPADVSFRDDVLPLFERSCALSTACHGNPDSPQTSSGYRAYLGAAGDGESDIPTIFEAIVGVDSFTDPSKKVVDPGDSTNSFMMYALDGALDQCEDLSCPDDCGFLMPKGLQKPLPIAERNLIRAWIDQGAQDN
jgi:hypothetical protein